MHPKTLIPVTRTSSEHYGNNLSYSIHLGTSRHTTVSMQNGRISTCENFQRGWNRFNTCNRHVFSANGRSAEASTDCNRTNDRQSWRQ